MPEDAIENVTRTCPFLLIKLLVVSSRLHSIQFLDFKCGSDYKKCYAYFSSFFVDDKLHYLVVTHFDIKALNHENVYNSNRRPHFIVVVIRGVVMSIFVK